MAKIVIDGFSDKIIQKLCKKWGYPETVKGTKKTRIPNPDSQAKKGSKITRIIEVDKKNPQSKMDFVKEHLILFATNEYRLQVRKDDSVAAEVATDKKVRKEVSLK